MNTKSCRYTRGILLCIISLCSVCQPINWWIKPNYTTGQYYPQSFVKTAHSTNLNCSFLPPFPQTSEASRSSIKSLHSDLLSQTEVFLEELRVRQEAQRREEEEAERQRKIREEKERREREVRVKSFILKAYVGEIIPQFHRKHTHSN